jgi:uncharacterized protein (UPF0297 family)
MDKTNILMGKVIRDEKKRVRKVKKERAPYARYNKDKILELLKDPKLTYDDISSIVGCSIDTVKYYTRKNKPANTLCKRLKKFGLTEETFLSYQRKDSKGALICSISGEPINLNNKDWAIGVYKPMGFVMIYLKKYSILFHLAEDKLISICKFNLEGKNYTMTEPKSFFV